MSIKDISGFQRTLGNADAKGWSQKVDNDFGGFKIETPGVGESGKAKSFGEFLQDSLGKVNDMQHEANTAMEKLASGESQNLHETLMAVEKADISFRTMNQVRTKVLDAYREIMKMQI
ncbi:MAG TPA: flagellar hook-basal body complex protein FliE [Bacteriovoracaceae bacterium]|nr:flagellar hook-basal body complex protein FliE [Bacteriovoracaceae bacterium]